MVNDGRQVTRGRKRGTALAVLGAGALVASSGGVGGVVAEFPASAFVSVCALLFVSRAGALMLVAAMAVLSLVSNQDILRSSGSTGREIGFAALFVLLFVIAVVGVVLDVVVGLVWRSARLRSPTG